MLSSVRRTCRALGTHTTKYNPLRSRRRLYSIKYRPITHHVRYQSQFRYLSHLARRSVMKSSRNMVIASKSNHYQPITKLSGLQLPSISKSSFCTSSSSTTATPPPPKSGSSFALKFLLLPTILLIGTLFVLRDKILIWAMQQIFARRESFLWECYPDRIILIRHGESQSNLDQHKLSTVPDHEIALTEKGRDQAIHAGEAVKKVIGDEDLYAYYSPYKRARETLHGILVGGKLTNQTKIQIEDVRLIEQKFGNHQDFEEMRKEKAARMKYSRYFYQFKHGESALDVTLRATAFSDRLFDHFRTGYYSTKPHRHWNVLVVSHGLFMRVFLKSFLRKTVDEFSQWYNYANCELCILEKGEKGMYQICEQTPLPTANRKRTALND